MMEASFAHEQLDWRYVNCEVAEGGLGAAVAGARAMGWRGFNCSIPHKQAVIPLLDGLVETAQICHAVNCAVRTDAGWFGHNTDGLGFLESARQVIDLTAVEVLVIGSGGAAHAIAIEVARAGARCVHVASRNSRTATALAHLVTVNTEADGRIVDWTERLVVPPAVRLVVNATPVGMSPHDDQVVGIDWESIPSGAVVADVVPLPSNTRFLQAAGTVGAVTIDGRGMLVNQAAENIRLWTAVRPDTSVMRVALDEALALA
jgi:shikimate dehydrogenase